MTSIALYIQWHTPRNDYRLAEYMYCLLQSLRNPYIGSVTLLLPHEEVGPILDLDVFQRYRYKLLTLRTQSQRCTYADWLQATLADHQNKNDIISILINTDTFLKEAGLTDLMSFLEEDMAVCLSRYEHFKGKVLHERPDLSQDAWMVRIGPLIKNTDLTSFSIPLGMPGCDNRIAALFVDHGYRIINPCNIVLLHHVHREVKRDYTESDRIPGNYCFIRPSICFEHSAEYYFMTRLL